MNKNSAFTIILISGILVLSWVLLSLYPVRLDLSKNHSYTISLYSKEVLNGLDSEMSVTWYRSPLLGQYSPSVRYIQDFLEEYRLASKKNFNYSILDPATEDPEKLASFGLVPRQIEVTNTDGKTFRDLYSGLIVEYRGDYRTIPFLLDTTTLEYDLTRLFLELGSAEVQKKQNKVQLLFGRNPLPDEYQYLIPWITYAGFEVKSLSLPVSSFDPDSILVLVGSSDTDKKTAALIEQFLDSGGNAVFFVSGNTVNTAGNWQAKPKRDDPVIDLLLDRNMKIETPLVLDLSNFRMTMPALDNSSYIHINYPFWITAQKNGLANHTILSGVNSIQFYWPSYITFPSPGNSAIQPLVITSPNAIIMEEPYNTDPFGKQLQLFSATAGNPGCLVATNTEKGRMILVADEYVPSALIEYTNSDTNLDFVVNCIEWLAYRDELLNLKNRQPLYVDATDTGTDDPEDTLITRINTARIINLAVLPSAVILLYLFISWRRKRNR